MAEAAQWRPALTACRPGRAQAGQTNVRGPCCDQVVGKNARLRLAYKFTPTCAGEEQRKGTSIRKVTMQPVRRPSVTRGVSVHEYPVRKFFALRRAIR